MARDNRKPSLVTGGCGFVGRHVTSYLLNRGDDVWLVDDLSIGIHPDTWLPADYLADRTEIGSLVRYGRAPTVTFYRGDCRLFFDNKLGFDVPLFGDVIHLAAVVGGRADIDGNPLAVAIDLAIDAMCFSWAIQARPDRLLYASSSAAYPIDLQTDQAAVALKESDINIGGRLGQPDMTYGWAKLTGEYLGLLAAERYGLHVASIRPFSGYGEDQDLSYPVPAIAARAAARETPIVVWGSGRQGRDFVHIDDCVEAMFRILDRVSDGRAINIGSGRLTNFAEVARLFADLEGYAPPIQPLDDKPVGVHSRYADIDLMTSLLDWKPQISIEDGFTRVLRAARRRIAVAAASNV